MSAEEEARACGLCGDPEFRIDGYCSIYCRDVHGEMEEAAALRSALSDVLEAAERLLDRRADFGHAIDWDTHAPDCPGCALREASVAARSVLGEKG